MSENEIWAVERDHKHTSRFVHTEADMLGVGRCSDEYSEKIKTYFYKREDAENYVLEIVKKAHELLVSDTRANAEMENDWWKKTLFEKAQTYEDRGIKMIRLDELKKDDPLYEFYVFDNVPTTVFVCPFKNEYDNDGVFYISIVKGKIY
jgi:hypothetical protein